MSTPPFEAPFVLTTPAVEPIPCGDARLYLPQHERPAPAIVFVHGMPFPGDWPPPPQWNVYIGYGSRVAAHGCVGAVIHHSHGDVDYDSSVERLTAAVATVRDHPRVDRDRVALWFFSGGAPMAADYLRAPPAWLRCVSLTYPLLDDVRSFAIPPRLRPIEAIAHSGDLPIVLSNPGREHADLAEAVTRFRAAADAAVAKLTVIDVPDGGHGFDFADHTPRSRAAVAEAIDLVTGHVTGHR